LLYKPYILTQTAPPSPSTPLNYVADSASASHGWSVMRSGGLERERAPERTRERVGGGVRRRIDKAETGREREKRRRR